MIEKAQLERKELKICVRCSKEYGKWIVVTECDKCATPVYELDDTEILCDEGEHICKECASLLPQSKDSGIREGV